jgi:DNA-binding NtrC family response regulator
MAEKIGKILAVDDNEDILFSLKLLLKNQVEQIDTELDPNRIPELLSKQDYDVILLDMNFTKDAISGREGFDWLKRIIEIDNDSVVLFITAYGDTEKAVKAIKAGATDFILKPWQNEKILATIGAAIQLKRSKVKAGKLMQKQQGLSAAIDQPFKDFIGVSPSMKEVFLTINKVAQTDASVLIMGENGTGKEVVARALHRNSSRSDDVFVSVDLGAIAETLFESELFGHERGAFTDAKKEKAGRFEIASGGTLFLDEIGNMTPGMQSKLLTALERREIIRVGSNKIRRIDIRLICATNAAIYDMVNDGGFRQDLLYRINTVEIHLPPLRERIEDIELLTDHFLNITSKKYKKSIKGFTSAALKKLEQYSWPGNIRELQHAIERAVIMSEGKRLEADDFLLSAPRKMDELELDTFNLDEVERKIITKVLQKYKGNVSHASKELGLTRTSLYRRMEKYGL